MDAKKFFELIKMKKAWKEGGEARQKLQENPKFEKEVKMLLTIG